MPENQHVALHQVSKRFAFSEETIHALREVDFSASIGELVMIVGPSGSGKTTLISSIAGTLTCDSGTIDLFGFPLSRAKEKDICTFRKKNIGFIFQHFHLIPTLTCEENVAIPLLLNGTAKNIAVSQAKTALEEVGIGDKAKQLPKKLSGGQQQRVAIARALVHRPRLILCDEPTSSLDGETGKHVLQMIRQLTKECCVLVVTHDVRIFSYANRIIEMNDGAIVKT
ncbi:MAG: ABC transporter ATP-binding protein [Waddliaceae bacterium]